MKNYLLLIEHDSEAEWESHRTLLTQFANTHDYEKFYLPPSPLAISKSQAIVVTELKPGCQQ